MLKFTKEEFDIMVDELLDRESVSYDMLCHIAKKTLSNKVKKWCDSEADVCGWQYYEDVMSAIYIRLIIKTITGFLLKQGPDGPVNNDPEGFQAWMFKVALNVKRTFFNKIRSVVFPIDPLDAPGVDELTPDDKDYELKMERRELLKKSFDHVLSLDIGIYKTLTWIAQFAFVWYYDITKIEATHVIETIFGNKDLFSMYDLILKSVKKIPWLEISDAQNQRILDALNEIRKDDTRPYGIIPYKELFMKKGGAASISDWVHRINESVRRNLENGTSDH